VTLSSCRQCTKCECDTDTFAIFECIFNETCLISNESAQVLSSLGTTAVDAAALDEKNIKRTF